MSERTLGRTGLRISALCLGCWRFGAETDAETATAVIHHAVDRGVFFIDTASIDSRGVSGGGDLLCRGVR
ncbi:aldo/keto reductase [Limnochorda pilosa]|uniref:Aldo/keto reductase n=1 Tax=Limnochorda pilosa TaxID=1555112 RepID=A0A0K2SMC5_LIMPI|nr:aldo/keto reductase [Limnochorda pilosa]BAS28278.1 aldo/keto reductase [Limnochorda pilosa]